MVYEEYKKFGDNQDYRFNMILMAAGMMAYDKAKTEIKSIEIPKGLTKERDEVLRSVKEMMEYVYTEKGRAVDNALMWVRNRDVGHLDEISRSSDFARDETLRAMAKLVGLKGELGINN